MLSDPNEVRAQRGRANEKSDRVSTNFQDDEESGEDFLWGHFENFIFFKPPDLSEDYLAK